MTAGEHPLRSWHLMGRRVRDRDGNRLGRIADVVLSSDTREPARVVGVLVTDGPWGRLLGYESPDDTGPWLLTSLSRWIIRRHVRQLDWAEVVLDAEES